MFCFGILVFSETFVSIFKSCRLFMAIFPALSLPHTPITKVGIFLWAKLAIILCDVIPPQTPSNVLPL